MPFRYATPGQIADTTDRSGLVHPSGARSIGPASGYIICSLAPPRKVTRPPELLLDELDELELELDALELEPEELEPDELALSIPVARLARS